MPKLIKINKSTEQGLKEILKALLKTGKVKTVLTLINKNGAPSYALIKDPEMISMASPLLPVMPANAGKLLSRLTFREPVNEPIAAVLRPCELHSFIELIKRNQASLENLLLISITCPGVYPIKSVAKGELKDKLKVYWDAVKKIEIIDHIRPTCKSCEHFLPYNADMTVNLMGKDIDSHCEIFVNTKKGENFIQDIDGEIREVDSPLLAGQETEEIKKMSSERESEKENLANEYKVEELGMPGLIKIFGKCIGCHSCSRVCPICYCNLCDFDSDKYEYESATFINELKKRGGIRVPPNTILFQMGRLSHVTISCVGCGMCQDVCPVDLPLSIIFSKIGETVQNLFNYIPGKDVEEEIPFTTFEEEELTEFED